MSDKDYSELEVVKQWIVVRRYYPDGKGGQRKLRLGKYIAQACHASIKWISDRLEIDNYVNIGQIWLSSDEQEWLENSFTKITLYVDTEEELLTLYEKCVESNIMTHLITDSGKTEFNDVLTPTCLAVGPCRESKVKDILGKLSLL